MIFRQPFLSITAESQFCQKAKKRPLTPEDMNLTPEKAEIYTEIIMDGQVMHENLKRLGLDLTWLEKELTKQKFSHTKDIFLGICDKNNNATFFPIN